MFVVPLPVFASRTTPSLGTKIEFKAQDTIDRNSTVVSFNSITGDILVRVMSRKNSSSGTAGNVSATWGTVPVVERSKGVGALPQSAIAWIGVVKGGPTGLGNLTITTDNVRNIIVWIQDIINAPQQPIGEAGSAFKDTSETVISADIDVQDAASLLVACGVFTNGTSDPFTLSTGWVTKTDVQTGGSGGSSSGFFTQRTVTTTGIETLTATATVADDQVALAILELLPI